MNKTITIAPSLVKTYPEIRLGCLHFTAEVKPSSDTFWNYLDTKVLPVIRTNMEGNKHFYSMREQNRQKPG